MVRGMFIILITNLNKNESCQNRVNICCYMSYMTRFYNDSCRQIYKKKVKICKYLEINVLKGRKLVKMSYFIKR